MKFEQAPYGSPCAVSNLLVNLFERRSLEAAALPPLHPDNKIIERVGISAATAGERTLRQHYEKLQLAFPDFSPTQCQLLGAGISAIEQLLRFLPADDHANFLALTLPHLLLVRGSGFRLSDIGELKRVACNLDPKARGACLNLVPDMVLDSGSEKHITFHQLCSAFAELSSRPGNDGHYFFNTFHPLIAELLPVPIRLPLLQALETSLVAFGANFAQKGEGWLILCLEAMPNDKRESFLKTLPQLAKECPGMGLAQTLKFIHRTLPHLGYELTMEAVNQLARAKLLPEANLCADYFSNQLEHATLEEITGFISSLPSLRELSFDLLNSRGPINNSLTSRLLVRTLSGVDDPDNHFTLSSSAFDQRWDLAIQRKSRSSIIIPADLRLRLTASTDANNLDPLVIGTLDHLFLAALQRKFVIPRDFLRGKIIEALKKMKPSNSEVNNIGQANKEPPLFDIIASAFQINQSTPTTLEKVLKISLPLLNEALELKPLPISIPKEFTSMEALRLLEGIEMLLGIHLPERLRAYGISELALETIAQCSQLTLIEQHLKKFKRRQATGITTLQICASHTVLDAYYDQFGQCCIVRDYGLDLNNAIFHPLRLMNSNLPLIFGAVYALRGTVHGIPSLILAGIEPRNSFVRTIRVSSFLKVLLDGLHEVALANELSGGVWTNVGPPTDKALWSDDGRIANHREIRAHLIPEGSPVIALNEDEQIAFPARFSRKISHVVQLR